MPISTSQRDSLSDRKTARWQGLPSLAHPDPAGREGEGSIWRERDGFLWCRASKQCWMPRGLILVPTARSVSAIRAFGVNQPFKAGVAQLPPQPTSHARGKNTKVMWSLSRKPVPCHCHQPSSAAGDRCECSNNHAHDEHRGSFETPYQRVGHVSPAGSWSLLKAADTLQTLSSTQSRLKTEQPKCTTRLGPT